MSSPLAIVADIEALTECSLFLNTCILNELGEKRSNAILAEHIISFTQRF